MTDEKVLIKKIPEIENNFKVIKVSKEYILKVLYNKQKFICKLQSMYK